MRIIRTLLLGAALLLSPAVKGQQTTQSQPHPKGQQSQPPTSGCAASPVKKPRFHLPKKIQEAINKKVKQINDEIGIELDPKTPGQVIDEAQKDKPCPLPQPADTKPAKQQ